MKRFLFLILSVFPIISCGSKQSPVNPSGNPFVLGGAGIFATAIEWPGINEMSAGIVDQNAQPVTNAAVTLSYPGGSSPLTLIPNEATTLAFTYSGGITVIPCASYITKNGYWPYVANQPYTFTAIFGGNTYTAWGTTSGNVTFSSGSGALTCTWMGSGSQNSLTATNGAVTTVFGPSLTSPYILLNSSLPQYTPGSYTLNLNIGMDLLGCFPGASPHSFFDIDYVTTTTY